MRDLAIGNLKRKDEPCGFCGGVGLVVKDGAFRACLCPLGQMPGVSWWHGVSVHPEDLVAETKKVVSVAKSVDLQEGRAYASR